MKKLITITLLIVSLLMGGFAADAKTARKRSKSGATKTAITKTPEEIEKEKAFTSPDLDFFNLHGTVKSVTIKVTARGYWPTSQYGYKAGTYDFDTKGNWVNYQQNDVTRLKRNNEGQIIAVILKNKQDDSLEAYDYRWKNNVILDYKSYNTNYSEYGNEPTDSGSFEYSHGVLIREKGLCMYYFNYFVDYKTTFSHFVYDAYGNWISCKVHCAVPEPYSDRGKIVKSSGTIKRTIEYY